MSNITWNYFWKLIGFLTILGLVLGYYDLVNKLDKKTVLLQVCQNNYDFIKKTKDKEFKELKDHHDDMVETFKTNSIANIYFEGGNPLINVIAFKVANTKPNGFFYEKLKDEFDSCRGYIPCENLFLAQLNEGIYQLSKLTSDEDGGKEVTIELKKSYDYFKKIVDSESLKLLNDKSWNPFIPCGDGGDLERAMIVCKQIYIDRYKNIERTIGYCDRLLKRSCGGS